MIPTMSQPSTLQSFARWPWREALSTLRERFAQDRLGLTAGSLTFTTSLALVPFFTLVLAIFTAFPMFAKMQGLLQAWLIESLVPEHIARQVLGYLTQFTRQASRLGVAGLVVVVVTAVALVLTIDRTLNAIWRVRQPRPLAQRLVIYWAAITIGPLLLAGSLAATSAVLPWLGGAKAGSGLVGALVNVLEFILLSGAMATMYRTMPNTHVKWSHAWAGGLCVAIGIALAKQLLALYLKSVPTYSLVYGAFATVPILLVWIYLAWLIVLAGAVVTAHLPHLLAGRLRRSPGAGWGFELALESLRLLRHARSQPPHGMTAEAMARELQVDPLQLEALLQTLRQLQWLGPMAAPAGGDEPVWVLLIDPEHTPIAPLAARLLIDRSAATERFWQAGGWEKVRLSQVL